MIADLIIRLCLWYARAVVGVAPRVITGRGNDTPYLTRYFLTRVGPLTEGMDHAGPAPKWGLYLHRFHRGDDGAELHSHPWRWAVSFILKGGYIEERRFIARTEDPPDYAVEVFSHMVRPWSLNVLTHRDFHRVDLFDGDAWSLFLVGPIFKSWGFWDRVTKIYTPWKKFLGVEP